MTGEAIVAAYVFVLAIFVGFEVVSKVSSTLHTPLMSGANAIHCVILIGAILLAGGATSTPVLPRWLSGPVPARTCSVRQSRSWTNPLAPMPHSSLSPTYSCF